MAKLPCKDYFISSWFLFLLNVPTPSIAFKMKMPPYLPSYSLSSLMNIISLLHNVFMQNKFISQVVK